MAIGILALPDGAASAIEQPAGVGTGTEVVLASPDTALMIGSQVVATGTPHRLYRVERVQGDWLWIVAGNVEGWVRRSEVIAFGQAMEDYAGRIAEAPYAAGWAYFQRGNLWLHKQEWQRAAADFTESLKETPKDAAILHNRALAWIGLKNFHWAIADLTAALEIDPRYIWAYDDRGRAWAELGLYDRAIADFTAALQLEPKEVQALVGRGLAYAEIGQPDSAIADLTEALRLDKNLGRAYTGRGIAWKAKHEYQRAIDDLNNAQQLTPNDADAHTALATIRATCPDARYRDGRMAFEAASRAYRLHGKTCAHCLDTLAAAYAECGDFPHAFAWQTKAIAALPDGDQEQQSFVARLALYRTNTPFRDGVPIGAEPIAVAPEGSTAGTR
jgi:tetratricopeptide (TPR) repeat protein